MINSFDSKPKNLTAFTALTGDFAPKMFNASWLLRHRIIDNETECKSIKSTVNASHSILDFNHCRLEARPDVLYFETDQLGFIPQTLDFFDVITRLLRNIPFKQIKTVLFIHYVNANRRQFVNDFAQKTMWKLLNSDEENSMFKFVVQQNNRDFFITLSLCPREDSLLHFTVENIVLETQTGAILKDMPISVLDDVKSSFNESILMINQVIKL